MVKCIILSIFLIHFFAITLYAQSKLEKQAFEYYENGEKHEALKVFKKLYQKYPNHKNFPVTFLNIAIVYQEIDSTEAAIEWYKKILASEIKDNQEWHIFPDTHTNIKHKSAFRLGNIYYNQDSIELGLKYYLLALEKYSYVSSSGTSKKKNNVNLKTYIADCYKKLNRPDDVVKILLSDAITASPWSKNPVSEYLLEHIATHYDKAKFIIDFEQALSQLTAKGDDFILPLWNDQIKIVPYGPSATKASDFIEEVKESDFYIELTKL